MPNKRVAISILALLLAGVILLAYKLNTGAAGQQEESLKIKHRLESQDARILKDKDAAGAKARARADDRTAANNVQALPFPEPDEYKTPRKWLNTEGRHGLVRTANTVWSVKGILEPNQEIWDEFVAWSGPDEAGKQAIGTFVENGGAFQGKFDAVYICPNQSIGNIYITDVKGDILYFRSSGGMTGSFDLDSHNWTFDKPDLFSADDKYIIIDPKTYIDKKFNFSVDYPADWKTEVEKTWSATSTQEGSPDGGIDIFIEGDKNEWIAVKGQYGTMGGFLSYPQEDFITADALKGKLFYTEEDNEYDIYMVLDENHHGAIIHVSKACFTRNKQQILGVLKSIKLEAEK